MFETFVIQPIFNLLLILNAAVGDFGVAIILFTVIVRSLMWPLLRRNLHQGRIIRKIQPEIKAIREKHKGNTQLQSQELSNLYKKYGVNPIGTFGLLFIQIPVFLGLFSALKSVIGNPERIIRLPYDFVASNETVRAMMDSVAEKTSSAVGGLENTELSQQILDKFNGAITSDSLRAVAQADLHQLYNSDLIVTGTNGVTQTLVQGPFFEQHLFGVIDLTGRAFSGGQVYVPVMIIALLAGVFQYLQTKQLQPKEESTKTIRQIMAEAAREGKEPNQSEVSAAMNRRLGVIFAPLITLISATSPSGLALYFASSGLVGLLQQRRVLNEDIEEMVLVADVSQDIDSSQKLSKAKQRKQQDISNKKKSSSKKRKR